MIVKTISRGANQHIRMISEGSCDTESWIHYCFAIAGNKLHFKMYSNRKHSFNCNFFFKYYCPQLLNGSVCIEKTFENLISYHLYTLCGYNNSSSWYKMTVLYLVTEKWHANSFHYEMFCLSLNQQSDVLILLSSVLRHCTAAPVLSIISSYSIPLYQIRPMFL